MIWVSMLFPPQEQCDGRTSSEQGASSESGGLAGLRCRNTFPGQVHTSAEGDREFSSMNTKGRLPQMLVRAQLVLSLLFLHTHPLFSRQRGGCVSSKSLGYVSALHLHLRALNTLQGPRPPQSPLAHHKRKTYIPRFHQNLELSFSWPFLPQFSLYFLLSCSSSFWGRDLKTLYRSRRSSQQKQGKEALD